MELSYKWFPQRLAFLGTQFGQKTQPLKAGLRVILQSAPHLTPRALGTKTYYTSTWVMVIPDTPLFEGVRSSNDLLSMDRTMLEQEIRNFPRTGR